MLRKRSVHLPEKKNSFVWVSVFVVLSIAIGVSAILLGKSDKGVIDVSATIQNANTTRSADSATPEVPPVPAEFANKVNGGLVPAGKESQPAPTSAPVVDNVTSTASSTDTTGETSSSTAPSAEGNNTAAVTPQ